MVTLDIKVRIPLVAGKIASHPAFVRFGPRIAEEGGADVPATWAQTET